MLIFDIDTNTSTFSYSVINGRAEVIGWEGEPETLTIPDEINGVPVTAIRDNAFYKCSSLKQIFLPDTLLHMGHHCFYDCTSLEYAELPDSLVDIGMGCFSGCSAMTHISLPDSISIIPDSCFRDCTLLETVSIPQNVTSIEKFAFSGCSSMTGVSLSGRLLNIGDYAFFDCKELKSIYLPKSVTELGRESLGYSDASEGHNVIGGFSIYGTPGSPAEDYAEKNSIEFRKGDESVQAFAAAEEVHTPVEVPDYFWKFGLLFFVLAVLSTALHDFRRRRKRP